MLFVSFLCLNVNQLGKTYAKDLKVEVTCTELQQREGCEDDSVLLFSLLSGGTRTGSASH